MVPAAVQRHVQAQRLYKCPVEEGNAPAFDEGETDNATEPFLPKVLAAVRLPSILIEVSILRRALINIATNPFVHQ